MGARRLFAQPQRHMCWAAGLVLFSLALAGCAGVTAPSEAVPFQQVPSALAPRSAAAARIATDSWILFAAAAAGSALVIGLLLYAMLRHPPDASEQPGAPNPPRFSANAWIVGGGVLMPLVILLAVFALGLGTLNAQSTQAAAEDLVIDIVGHQWWWEVKYASQGFGTANEVHIPVGRPVTLRLSTADVIHSFWVPELAGKLDLVPGRTNTLVVTADQTGEYRGQCAEFCGLQHALMSLLVVAEPADQFNAWLAAQQSPAPVPAEERTQAGQQVFLGSACVYCHTVRGTNASGEIGPDLTHVASRRTLAAAALLNGPGNLAGWIIDPQGVKPGNKMPPTNLSGEELQALLAYLGTLR